MLSKLWLYTTNVLQFLNLLEPKFDETDPAILSLSKIFAWIMIIVMIFVILTMPENIVAMSATAGVQLLSMVNYGFRRMMATKGKEPKE